MITIMRGHQIHIRTQCIRQIIHISKYTPISQIVLCQPEKDTRSRVGIQNRIIKVVHFIQIHHPVHIIIYRKVGILLCMPYGILWMFI